MIYAIAMTEDKLSHQFSKSEYLNFYNEQEKLVATCPNPALGLSTCSAKKLIIELFHKMACDVVIVRKVGEKTLAKLLNAGFQVEKGNTRHSISQLLQDASAYKHPLTQPSQGVKGSCGQKGNHDKCCNEQ